MKVHVTYPRMYKIHTIHSVLQTIYYSTVIGKFKSRHNTNELHQKSIENCIDTYLDKLRRCGSFKLQSKLKANCM